MGTIMWRRGVACGLGAIVLAGCATVPIDRNGEEARLMEISREWSRAAATGNVDAVVNYWAEDAVVMMAGLPTFTGKEAIRNYVAESFNVPGFAIAWEPLEAHVSASGDMGYIVERSEVTLPDAAGRPVAHRFRAVSIWRKDAGQGWRNVVDISNAPPGEADPP